MHDNTVFQKATWSYHPVPDYKSQDKLVQQRVRSQQSLVCYGGSRVFAEDSTFSFSESCPWNIFVILSASNMQKCHCDVTGYCGHPKCANNFMTVLYNEKHIGLHKPTQYDDFTITKKKMSKTKCIF